MAIVMDKCHGDVFEAKKAMRKALDGEYFELTLKSRHEEAHWCVSRIHTSDDGTRDYWVVVSEDMQIVTFGMNVIWKAKQLLCDMH